MPEPKRKAREKKAVGLDPLDALDSARLAGLLGDRAERPNGASAPPEGQRAMRRTRTRRDAARKKSEELQLELETQPESAPKTTTRHKRYDPRPRKAAARGADAESPPAEPTAAALEPQVAPPAEPQVAPPAEPQETASAEAGPPVPVERAWEPRWEDDESLASLPEPSSIAVAVHSSVWSAPASAIGGALTTGSRPMAHRPVTSR